MSDEPSGPVLTLSPRQKRLRTATLVILLFIVAMLAFSLFHPFFHPAKPPILTDRVKKALAAQGIMILGYYTVVFALALSLLFIAWLYVREIRLQILMAQRDIWKDIVDRRAEEKSNEKKQKTKRNGNEP